MRKKKNQSRLQSIGEILFSSFKGKGVAAKIEENSLMKLWPKAVGQQIVLQTQPDCLKNGTLFVKTTSSVWVQQLHFMKDEILHLEKKFQEHRTGKIICPETCFCWEVDQWIAMREIEKEGENDTSRD